MTSCKQWGKNILINIVSLFFITFSLETLVGSFYLRNPFEFIMLFFSSGLMILLSLVGLIYSTVQAYALFKLRKAQIDSHIRK
jgi:hypothetical protein